MTTVFQDSRMSSLLSKGQCGHVPHILSESVQA